MKQAVWLAAALMMLLPLGKVYSKERSERENNTLCIMSYNIVTVEEWTMWPTFGVRRQ